MAEIARILETIDEGDAQAAEELLPLVYDELRRLAAQKMAQEKPGQTLQATALVHEAYIRLMGSEDQHWDSRGHFFAAAAEAMRRILVENGRRKTSLKHGGGRQHVELVEGDLSVDGPTADVVALDDALTKLAQTRRKHAELVKLRFYAGLTGKQAAKLLGISPATAERYWTYAQSWLFVELCGDDEAPGR